ncbi:glutathione S-transferase [Nesidiocoris tenuis]|uniref:Glutathione S-transferase n=1 Tax=Nesidiocoris tenuis TaxID=355587 RepID=A0ABN7ASJ4_9HEMI|nr:glutathione S-transferase [Nesidiocoris tenuis]
MTIDFYYSLPSAPCRSVLLAAKAIGLDLNLKLMDLMKGEHMTPEFIKINPQHCIPTLIDDGFVLLESRAIMTYLVSKYGKDDSLYPTDPKKRAVVDQRLYFDMGTLIIRFGELYYPFIFRGADLDEEKIKKFDEAFKFLDLYLGQSEWAAGDNLTVADFALVSSVSTAEACDWDINKYPNVAKWYAKCKTSISGFAEINLAGADFIRTMYITAKNKK